nr:hypothetical protein [Candidatus Sigynarchaeota archaeon]
MVKPTPEAITEKDLAVFKCPAKKCNGFLVPYEIKRNPEKVTIFSTCYDCKKRYKFKLSMDDESAWMPSLRKFTWRCPFCADWDIDIKKAVGFYVFRVSISCNKCQKNASKKIEHEIYEKLMAGIASKPQVSNTKPGENLTEHTEPGATPAIKGPASKKKLLVCPACELEITEEFKGYCPGCGFRFSAEIEDRP